MKPIRTMLMRGLVAAGLGLILAPATASADFLDYTVVEGVVPGAIANNFTADKLNGGYVELISFDGSGNFVTSAIADFTQYRFNEGANAVGSQLAISGPTETANQYGLYAVFYSTGTTNGTEFFGNTGYVELWLDPNLDTTKVFTGCVGTEANFSTCSTGASGITVGSSGDDIKILDSANLFSAYGEIVGPIGGFFDLVFADPNLTAFGQSYWVGLPLLNLQANVDGDFDVFTPTPGATFQLTGDVSNVFTAVPEPATLTLLGFGLAGARFAARRRKATASV